jgi:hypothetical protein
MARLFRQRFDFKIEQPNLCQIFKSNKMKRIFLVSCYIIASVAMQSCTNDDVESTPNNKEVRADEPGDGQSGQTPIPPPK